MKNTDVELVIRFPSEQHLKDFHGWFCDGGGESQCMEASEESNEENPIIRFQYHAEDPKYKENDRRRYSPFPEGNKLIIAHSRKGN